jgi:hypothetical protein
MLSQSRWPQPGTVTATSSHNNCQCDRSNFSDPNWYRPPESPAAGPPGGSPPGPAAGSPPGPAAKSRAAPGGRRTVFTRRGGSSLAGWHHRPPAACQTDSGLACQEFRSSARAWHSLKSRYRPGARGLPDSGPGAGAGSEPAAVRVPASGGAGLRRPCPNPHPIVYGP